MLANNIDHIIDIRDFIPDSIRHRVGGDKKEPAPALELPDLEQIHPKIRRDRPDL